MEKLNELTNLEKGMQYICEHTEAAKRILREELGLVNWQIQTMGGEVFWEDHAEYRGWRLQQNVLFHNTRVLNPQNERIAWGLEDDMCAAFVRLIELQERDEATAPELNLRGKCALVLGGGGGKGAYEIGIWKRLRECGLESVFSAVYGTSVGALNAALFSQGDIVLADRIWSELRPEEILPPNRSGGDALYDTAGLAALIERSLIRLGVPVIVGCARVVDPLRTAYEGAAAPAAQSGSDLEGMIRGAIQGTIGGYPSLFDRSATEERTGVFFDLRKVSWPMKRKLVLASAALPVVFDRVEIDGSYYRDGGLIEGNNTPYRKAAESGASRILAVDLHPGEVAEFTERDSRVLLLRPRVSLGELLDGTLDFNGANAVRRIQQGYEDCCVWEPRIREFLTIK